MRWDWRPRDQVLAAVLGRGRKSQHEQLAVLLLSVCLVLELPKMVASLQAQLAVLPACLVLELLPLVVAASTQACQAVL